MIVHRLQRVFVMAVILAITALFVPAQTLPNFNRPQTYDAQHYIIRASFDPASGGVTGDTTVVLRPLSTGFRVVELDAVNMQFDSVTLEPSGVDVQYRTLPGKIVITLDKTYGPEDSISLRIRHRSTPKKGVYFRPATEVTAAQIWTQGEADEARHWFPSFDFPSDKATTEQILTVAKGATVIANGGLIDRKANADGTETWHYRMTVPHSIYLVSFVIGQYVKVEDRYKNIPLAFYTYPGREANARRAFGETAEMMRIFEELTGVPYPYNKYDQTVVTAFNFGGMENITATTMSDTEIFLADFDFGKSLVTDLVSHELAHSWFGNLVTCRNWAELWLNEGFATFMEAAYLEKARGRAAYIDKIRTDAGEFLSNDAVNRRKHGLFNRRAGDVSSLFDNAAITYHKGGAVVHTLREQIGNDAFWRGIKIYLDRHKFASVESTDLRNAMEEASGQNLEQFFRQWVYGIGSPRLHLRQTYNVRLKTLTLTVTQTQMAGNLQPAAFQFPLDVTVKTSNGETKHILNIRKRSEAFNFKTGRPVDIDLDPELRVPLKTVKTRPLILIR